MKDLCQYGNRPEDEWEILPWIPDPRPPFKIWVKPEQIAPFFLIPNHPYAISLLLKISAGFRAAELYRLGLSGSSEDWELSLIHIFHGHKVGRLGRKHLVHVYPGGRRETDRHGLRQSGRRGDHYCGIGVIQHDWDR